LQEGQADGWWSFNLQRTTGVAKYDAFFQSTGYFCAKALAKELME
jgi:hypothetical protein